MRTRERSAGVMPWLKAAPLAILLSGCAGTTVSGDAGCASYAEARTARPAAGTIVDVPAPWAAWIADLDDRMTGTCRTKPER